MPKKEMFDNGEVLKKALFLFWEKGFNGTSIANLETTMGINRSSIYNTYGNKNELFLKALEFYTEVQKASLYSEFIKDKSSLTAIRLLFESLAKETLSDKTQKGCFLVNTTTELANQDPGLRLFLIKAKETMVSIFTELIGKAQAAGEVPVEKDAKAIALYFFSSLQGLRVTGMLSVRKKELQQIAESVLHILE